MKPYSILHISDLHRSPHDPISNDELISALVGDRDRYIAEEPQISAPEAIVVSGDIIQGVRLGASNFETELSNQYQVAGEFLDELVKRFLDGDRARLILIPGNHDIDWNTAFAALEPVEERPENLASLLSKETSEYRWDWKNLILYRIADPGLYERRLEAFWAFFEKFYKNVPGLFKVKLGSDANLFNLFDNRIGVAAYNSCHGNDCFAYHGMIRKEAIARSHLELNDTGTPFDLRLAVWHHSIEGPPYRTDYMDVEIVRGMIGRGFRLGLYGHQHKTQVAQHHVWLPDRERMAVVSAGSLCAGPYELPTGVHRQYNVLEISPDFQSVRVHVRAMAVANLFSRGHLMDFGGRSFAELGWSQPQNAAGVAINVEVTRNRKIIEQAEVAAKTGDPAQSVELLQSLDLPVGSHERALFLTAATNAYNWDAIVSITNPPMTIDELVQRVDALTRMGDTAEAISDLERFSQQLQLPEPVAAEIHDRIRANEAMKR